MKRRPAVLLFLLAIWLILTGFSTPERPPYRDVHDVRVASPGMAVEFLGWEKRESNHDQKIYDLVWTNGIVTWFEPKTGTFGTVGHRIDLPDDLGHGYSVAFSGEPAPEGVFLYGMYRLRTVKEGDAGVFFRAGDFEPVRTGWVETGWLDDLARTDVFSVAAKSEVRPGPATVVTRLFDARSGRYIRETVRVEITGVCPMSWTIPETRYGLFGFRVADPDFLSRHGGIIPGMSGSPVFQEGRLVGAVSYRSFDRPADGCGTFAEDMLREAGIID